MSTQLKVCCIASAAEAATAIEYGAGAVGLVSAMPSGPGPIPDTLIEEIALSVPSPIATFLLTCRTEGPDIVDHLRACKTNTVQLVDAVQPGAYEEIRRALPLVRIVQVIHVMDETAIREAVDIAPLVDVLLLDSGNPHLDTKVLGGTGQTHNWLVSREIVDRVNKPVYLAGGINPQNVAQAISTVRPFGIDICTGIRTGGRLDENKLGALVRAMGGPGKPILNHHI